MQRFVSVLYPERHFLKQLCQYLRLTSCQVLLFFCNTQSSLWWRRLDPSASSSLPQWKTKLDGAENSSSEAEPDRVQKWFWSCSTNPGNREETTRSLLLSHRKPHVRIIMRDIMKVSFISYLLYIQILSRDNRRSSNWSCLGELIVQITFKALRGRRY